MTEWELQKALTHRWLSDQPVLLGGEPFFLAAWEVMSDYRINDSRRHWNRPSIDFLFLDRHGHLAALELKLVVNSPRQAWGVLCQVTHRAYVLGEAYCQPRLEAAYVDCYSGLDSRHESTEHVDSLLLAHARAFSQDPLERLPGVPVRRFVMATSFGPSFDRVLSTFNHAGHDAVTTALRSYAQSTELKRFLAIPESRPVVNAAPVHAFEVPEP